jgi:hypothetical protein
MCGPLALALPATGSGRFGFAAGRVAYTLGRITTYSLLGLVFGLIGRSLTLFGVQRWVSLGAGILLLLGLFASTRWGVATPVLTVVAALKRSLSRLLKHRSLGTVYLFGMVNGLLPCGLVYAAGAGATAAGSVGGAVAYMALFGLGTTPLMLGLALSRNILPGAFRLKLQRLIPVSLAVVAGLLIVRGLALGIPYLSPAMDAGAQNVRCH